MPWCNNCQHQVPASNNKLTPATKRLWCPTWLGSEKGPIDICDECAKVFIPEHNPYGRGGSFHWGDEADKAFKAVEANIPHTDGRFANTRGMIHNGQKIVNHRTLMEDNAGLFVVDGKVWLLTGYNAVRLGTLEEARENFPILFKDE